MPETGTGCPQLLYTLLTETGSPAEFVPCTFWLAWLASLPGNPVPLLLTVGIAHGCHLCLPCIWGSRTDQVLRLVQQVLSFSPQLHDNYFFLFFTNGIIRKLSIFSEVSGLYQNSHREAVAYLLMVFIHFIWYIESWWKPWDDLVSGYCQSCGIWDFVLWR